MADDVFITELIDEYIDVNITQAEELVSITSLCEHVDNLVSMAARDKISRADLERCANGNLRLHMQRAICKAQEELS